MKKTSMKPGKLNKALIVCTPDIRANALMEISAELEKSNEFTNLDIFSPKPIAR